MITLAEIIDLEEIDHLAVKTIKDMMASSIPQWTLEYPRKNHYTEDLKNNALYVFKIDSKIVGAMTLKQENDPPYKTLDNWLSDNSLVIHRIIVDPLYRNQKIAQKLFNFAYEQGAKNNYNSIKIDTHLENFKMRRFLQKNNFKEIGYLKVIDRIAYEKLL